MAEERRGSTANSTSCPRTATCLWPWLTAIRGWLQTWWSGSRPSCPAKITMRSATPRSSSQLSGEPGFRNRFCFLVSILTVSL